MENKVSLMVLEHNIKKMDNKVLLMLLEYNVEFDKEINTVGNINNIRERTRMQLFFIYSILANYRNIDTIEIPEIKKVAIGKLYYLYSNCIKLRLEEINLTFLHILEINPAIKSILENKLLSYIRQVTDLLLEGSVNAWTVFSRREVDKIVSSCVDVVFEEIKLKRRK